MNLLESSKPYELLDRLPEESMKIGPLYMLNGQLDIALSHFSECYLRFGKKVTKWRVSGKDGTYQPFWAAGPPGDGSGEVIIHVKKHNTLQIVVRKRIYEIGIGEKNFGEISDGRRSWRVK